jgi:hypothetical protein
MMSRLRLPPRALDDVAAPTPSTRKAEGAPARPRSDRWCEVELITCCAAAASSSAFSCWHTRRSSEVAGSGLPRNSRLQWQGSETPAGRVAEHQCQHWLWRRHRRSYPCWRVGCCHARRLLSRALVVVMRRSITVGIG